MVNQCRNGLATENLAEAVNELGSEPVELAVVWRRREPDLDRLTIRVVGVEQDRLEEGAKSGHRWEV